MTPTTLAEVEAPHVEDFPLDPAPKSVGRESRRSRIMRRFVDWRDTLVHTARARKMADTEIQRRQRAAIDDPAVEQALHRAIAVRRERKASGERGLQGGAER
jgi:hypothetical protein